MRYGALIGWGVVIYAVTTLSWFGLTIYGVAESGWSLIVQLVILISVTTIAGRSLRFHLWPDILPYSLTWAGIALSLDIIYKVPFLGWGFFADWSLWVGYALVTITPLITLKRSEKHTAQA